MSDLPPPVSDYLLELNTELSPAYLRVDPEGRFLGGGGALSKYGISDLQPGQTVANQVSCLHGILPLEEERLVLPCVEIQPGSSVHIHFLRATEGYWVVFLDASAETKRLQRVQQSANELTLLKAVFEKSRTGGARSTELEQAGSALDTIVARLNLAIFRFHDDRRLEALGQLRPWVEDLLSRHPENPESFSIDGCPPVLDAFLGEALLFWSKTREAPLKSGIWSEDDRDGKERYLEATALTFETERLLILELLDPEQDERLQVIRKARSGKLEAQQKLGKQRKEIAAYRSRLRTLALELSRAEEQERLRIAAGMHDHIGQILAITKIKLGSLRQAGGPSPLSEDLSGIAELVNEAIDYTRSLTFELGSPVLYEFGLEAAIESLAERSEKQHGFEVSTEIDPLPTPLSRNVSVVLFQALRELLHNVKKHAGATRVRIRLKRVGKEIHLVVEDNGKGFEAPERKSPTAAEGGFGLFNIRERLGQLGGRLELEAGSRRGATVRMVVPEGSD